jgi:hypothetical protein
MGGHFAYFALRNAILFFAGLGPFVAVETRSQKVKGWVPHPV